MSDWYYMKDGWPRGPVQDRELRELVDAGQLGPTDTVRKATSKRWRPASEVRGLFSSGPATKVAVAAQPDSPAQPTGEPDQPVASDFLYVVSLSCGLIAMISGAAAVVLFWTPLAGWMLLAAMVALIAGNVGLAFDWFRDVPRFTVSVMGSVAGTVAIGLAFVHQGGLDFKRYKPVVITKHVVHEVIREVPAKEKSAGKELAAAGGVLSRSMTRKEFTAKVDALGNPCKREALYQAVGKPVRTQSLSGQLQGLYWYWDCKDGMIQMVLLNPGFGVGQHNDEGKAYISEINEY